MGTQGSNGSQGEIDGRGDQDILGTAVTWWALSSQAQTDDDQQNNPRLIESDGFNNLFYGTHGISIGGETQFGVSNVLIENDTIQGTDSSGRGSTSNNGIRIKTDSSDGGKVSDVTYDGTRTSASSTPTSPRRAPT